MQNGVKILFISALKKLAATATAAVLLFTLSVSAAAIELIPVGRAVGITMSTGGLLVSGLSNVETDAGTTCPAAEAGIRPGDLIVSVNGCETITAEEFISAINGGGEKLTLEIIRGDERKSCDVCPVESEDGTPKLGLWLRDGISGIGTVTFIDPESGLYGALGHPISDAESGTLIPVGEGSVTYSEITDIHKGQRGVPGELCGSHDISHKTGSIERNTASGIFGTMTEFCQGLGEPVEVASESEIRTGSATILANVRGSETESFDVTITRVYSGDSSGRSVMLEVTDPELLELTGGIVQGMSGSPILQNGKLIGAVTHVLVNNPACGYGVSISSMLAASGGAEVQQDAA